MLDILLFYGILASVFTFGKQIVTYAQPFFSCALRLIPAGILLLIGSYIFERKQFNFYKRDFPALLGLIFFVFCMDALRFFGLQYVGSSYGALLSTLSPFIAAFISYWLYKESITWKKIGAFFLGVLAVLPLIIKNLQTCTECSSGELLLGYGALLISTIGVVVRSYFLKDLVDKRNYAISFVLGLTFVATGVVCLLLSHAFETWNPLPAHNFSTVIPLVLFLMVFYSLMAQPLYAHLMKKYPITIVTFFILTTPIITALINWACYGITIGWPFVFSCTILSLAFVLFNHEEHKKNSLKG